MIDYDNGSLWPYHTTPLYGWMRVRAQHCCVARSCLMHSTICNISERVKGLIFAVFLVSLAGAATFNMSTSTVLFAADGVVKPRLHDTTGCKTGLTTGLTTELNEQLFDNRLYRVYKHLPGCHTGLTTGLTTGCIV